MRRLAALLIFLILTSSLMASYGTDRDIGVLCDVETGSAEENVVSFFRGEYSLESLEKHVAPELLAPFTRQYGTMLSQCLPLDSLLISRGEGYIKLKDTAKGVLLDVFHTDEGLITSIGVR